MKFTVNKNLFLEKLQIAQKALASRSNMPALTGVLITCKDEVLTLVTSNGEIAIKVFINEPSLSIESEGSCLVPGKIFGEIVRKLNGDEIDFEYKEDNIMRIQAGFSDVTLNLLEVEDYPEPRFEDENVSFSIKASLLKELIKETTFAASIIDNKPILTGVNFKVNGNSILAVSTDSFRLSKRIANLDEEFLDTNIIIPSRSLNEYAKIIEDTAEPVEVCVSPNKVLFKTDTVMFQARLLEGTYPETSRLIPVNFPVILKFNKTDLISAIDRVSTLSSSQSTTTVVKLKIDENGDSTLESNYPELGKIKDSIKPVEVVSVVPLTISFSSSYFLDGLRAFYSENVYVKFNGEVKPFIFEADNDEGLVELVLPMKTD